MANRDEADEVVKEVKNEIKKMGDGFDSIKTNQEEIQKNLETFKKEVEKQNGKTKQLNTRKFRKIRTK